MRWLLLLAAMSASFTLLGQSTLKIYVVTDDGRSDMDIIDLNTSAIDQYGRSVDSTNMNYYTPTMSTQVVRLSYEELYGVDERVDELDSMESEELLSSALDEPTSSTSEDILSEIDAHSNNDIPQSVIVKEPALPQPVAARSTASTSKKVSNYNSRDTKSKAKSKRVKFKKRLKSKRYRGQCPKFS